MKRLIELVLYALCVSAFYLIIIYFSLNADAGATTTVAVKRDSDVMMNVVTRHKEVISNKTIYQLVLQENEESELITVYVDSKTYVKLGRGSKVLVPGDFYKTTS